MTRPLDYPVVTIGGREYVLKYSLVAKYHLSRQKISELDLLNALAEFERAAMAAVKEGRERFTVPAAWTAAVIDAWSACVSHMYLKGPERAPTGEQWAETLEPEFDKNPLLLGQLFAALQKAILKAAQPSEAAPEAAQPAAPLN